VNRGTLKRLEDAARGRSESNRDDSEYKRLLALPRGELDALYAEATRELADGPPEELRQLPADELFRRFREALKA
jgi:hypothetical protein